jgi:predicted porin
MNTLRRIIAAIEPWYDWGKISITNLDARTESETVEGDVRYVDLQWFGIHLSIQFGRTPKRVLSLEPTT